MSREDAHKLLGGYATGTLTEAEQRALFAAALEDQELFDALAREQALRDLLDDPMARAQVLASIDAVPVPWYRKLFQPLPATAMVAAATALVMLGVWQSNRPVRPTRMAKLDLPAAATSKGAVPELPPAPEVKLKAPDLGRQLSIPGVPLAAPPPPPPSAIREEKVAVATGAASGGRADLSQGVTINGAAPMSAPAQRFAPSSGPLRGVVTDATGAGIANAAVDVKSLSTGEVVHPTVNQRGEFAVGVAGSTYEISAAAPGFRKTTISNVSPSNDPLQVKLEVGAIGGVMVTAAAPSVAVAGGRAGRGGGGSAANTFRQQQDAAQQAQQGAMQQSALQPGNFQQLSEAASGAEVAPLAHAIYRRGNNNELLPVADGESIARGAKLLLRLTSRQDGAVQLSESSGRQLATRPVKAAQPLDLDLPNYTNAGVVELSVRFSSAPILTAELAKAKKSTAAPAHPALTIKLNIR